MQNNKILYLTKLFMIWYITKKTQLLSDSNSLHRDPEARQAFLQWVISNCKVMLGSKVYRISCTCFKLMKDVSIK